MKKINFNKIISFGAIIIVFAGMFALIIKAIFEEDHVIDCEPTAIDGHIYKRVYGLGSTYFVDDIENCPKCKTYIINIADSISKNR